MIIRWDGGPNGAVSSIYKADSNKLFYLYKNLDLRFWGAGGIDCRRIERERREGGEVRRPNE